MKKNIVFFLLVFFLGLKAFAECDSVDKILTYAQTGQIRILKKCENLDIVDENNRTALCHSILKNDLNSYRLLKKLGSNLNPPCLEKIPPSEREEFARRYSRYIDQPYNQTLSEQGKFLGLGTFGWNMAWITVAGGALLAASLSGGGGGGSGENLTPDYIDMLNELNLETDTYTLLKYPQANNRTQYIQDNSGRAIIGMYSDSTLSNSYDGNAVLKIEKGDNASNAIYGIVNTSGITRNTLLMNGGNQSYVSGLISIESKSKNSGPIYGIYGYNQVVNVASYSWEKALADIKIKNVSDADIFGIYSRNIASNVETTNTKRGEGVIQIQNYGNGNSFGIYSKNQIYNLFSDSSTNSARANVKMYNLGDGNACALYSENGSIITGGRGSNVYSYVELYNLGQGKVIGLSANRVEQSSFDEIYISNLSNGTAIGISGFQNSYVKNNGTITIRRASFSVEGGAYITLSGQSGTSIGIYAAQGSSVLNSGTIDIASATRAFGIYAQGNGGTITNSGTIQISAKNAYGIYVENGINTKVYNTGVIKLNGTLCSGNCSGNSSNGNYIVLNGATLVNDGAMFFQSLDANLLGGSLVAGKDAQFDIQDSFKGTLNLSSELVSDGFNTTYINKDMIKAGDISQLNLISKSALFDVQLADNNSDIIMKMKAFDSVVKNASLAHFLTNNYTLGNNEKFFSRLKTFENVSLLSEGLDKLIGKDLFSHFNFADMTMIRELNFDINKNLFYNKEKQFSMAGSVHPMMFKGSIDSKTRYSLTTKREDGFSIGLGVAFTNVHTDNDQNNRYEAMYQMIVPVGYYSKSFNLIMSPQFGYARGTYKRIGFDEESYGGIIEKRVYGLMNEARFPLQLLGWSFEPSVEFNILGYRQKGREKSKEFSLNMIPQNTYSIENGIGVYLTKEKELSKGKTLRLTMGLSGYHEFLDPYKVKLGMNGMDGFFTVRDENRSNNRAVARFGFNYKKESFTLYGSLNSYIDKKSHYSGKTGFKWNF